MYNWYLQWLCLLLFGIHPPVSSCLIAVLLMFYSVSCVNFCTFIHNFRKYSFCYLVFILRSPLVLLLFLIFYSVSCVIFFNFIHIFRKFCKCLVVLFNEHILTYGPVICFCYFCYETFSVFLQYCAFE